MNKILLFAGAAVAAAVLAGCAAMEASNQESLMAAAGFRERVPQTAKQQAIYEQMPAYQIQSMPVGDQIVYLYKDPKQGVVYYGGEAEYGRYKQLSLQQSISDQQVMAAQLNQQTAMMYSGWGPWGLWY